MSELAYRYQDNGVYTRTEGNVTRLYFNRSDDGNRGKLFALPVQEEPMTPRQAELAKAERRDMTVVPLESYDQVKGLISFFEDKGQYREACVLVFGFCTGLRISDLIRLKVSDIISSADPLTFKAEIDIHEQKTGKRTVSHVDSLLITEAMQAAFTKYFSTKPAAEKELDRYLFATRQSYGRKPVSARMVQLNLEPAFAAVCPHLHCSTHTMRKTFVSIINAFASQATMTGGGISPMTACQIALRHASAATTMAYMGTMKSGMLSLRRAVSDFVLGRTVIKSLKTEYTWELVDD